jgi:hypothetical protein
VIPTGGTFPNDLIAADVGSLGGAVDGQLDLIVVNGGTLTPGETEGSVSIFFRKAAGAGFEAPVVLKVGTGGALPASSSHACVADVTSDGLLDIVVANPGDSSVSVVVQAAPGVFVQGAVSTIALASFGIPPFDINTVAVADFNADGLPDLVTGGALSQRLLVLRGADPDGPGGVVSFPGADLLNPTLLVTQSPPPPPLVAGFPSAQPAPTFFVGVSPRRIAADDLTGDGLPDLAVVENVQGRVTLFVNQGTAGPVTAFDAVVFPCSLNPIDLEIGDISGDRRPDLLVGGSTLGDISRFQALVPGTLDRFVSFPTGPSPQSVLPVDLTATYPGEELVVVNSGDSSLTVLARDGAGGLRPLSPFPGVRDVPLEAQDKALLSPTPGVGSLRLLAATSVAAADFNGDGQLDLAVSSQSSAPDGVTGTAVLLNEGGVAPIRTTTRVVLGRALGFNGSAAQVVGDATPDLIVVEFLSATSGALNLFRGAAGTTFVQDAIFPMALPATVTPADLDGDGDQDLIVPLNAAFPPNFQILIQDPAGTLTGPLDGVTGGISLPGFSGASFAVAGDMNNDGLQDVVFTNFLGSLVGVAYQNNPATTPPRFDRVEPLLSLLQPAGVAVGDLNDDGLPDLAVSFAGDGQVGVFYQNPGTNKAPAQALAGPILLDSGPSPFALAISDVNGDGRNDLVASSRGANTLNVFFQR